MKTCDELLIEYQNEFIDLVERRTETNTALTDLQRKYLIMQEKKLKMSNDIENQKQSLVDLKRRIEVKNGAIVRINKQFSDEKTNYNSSVEAIEDKRALEVNTMSNIINEVSSFLVKVVMEIPTYVGGKHMVVGFDKSNQRTFETPSIKEECAKGVFNNYVDIILPFFDPLPSSSCPRSY